MRGRMGVRAVAIAATALPLVSPLQSVPAQRPVDHATVIEGRVLDGVSRQPVAMAIVTVRDAGHEWSRRALTDAAGAFRLEGLRPGAVVVEATKPGLVSEPSESHIALSLQQRAATVRHELLLRPATVLAGRISNESGAPLPSVPVVALRVLGTAEHPVFEDAGKTTSTDLGDYEFLLPAGRYVIAVPVQAPQSHRPAMRLGARPAIESVRDRATGIHVAVPPGLEPPTADASSAPATRAYATTFYPEASSIRAATIVDVDWGARREDLTIRLRPRPVRRISGRVSPAPGLPPASAFVSLVADDLDVPPQMGSRSVFTRPDGSFTFVWVSNARHRLSVSRAELVSGSHTIDGGPSAVAEIAPGNADQDVTLVMDPRDDARPLTTTHHSDALASVRAREIAIAAIAQPRSTIAGVVVDDRAGPVVRARVAAVDDAGVQVDVVATDDSGLYELQVGAAGTFTLYAEKAGYASIWPRGAVSVSLPLTSSDLVELRLERGSVLSGVVLDREGRPVPGVQVGAHRDGTDVTAGAVTNSRGEYRISGLRSGRHRVIAYPEERTTATGSLMMGTRHMSVALVGTWHPAATRDVGAVPIDLGVGDERRGVDVQLQVIETWHLDGRIELPGGASLEELEVSCSTAGSDMLAFANDEVDTTRLRFRCAGLTPGPVRITARGTRNPDRPREDDGERTLWGATDLLMSPQPATAAVRLFPGATINGRLVPADGTDPGRAVGIGLTFRYLEGLFRSLDSGHRRVEALPGGVFAFRNLPPGRHVLGVEAGAGITIIAASAGGLDVLDLPIAVDGLDVHDLRVVFVDRPTTLSGVVTQPNGMPLPGRRIAVFPVDRKYWFNDSPRLDGTESDANGRFAFTGLRAGDYYVALAGRDIDSYWFMIGPAGLPDLIPSAQKLTITPGREHRVSLIER